MRQFFFFLLILSIQLINNSAFGEKGNDDTFLPGYVVLNSGDTITGFILVENYVNIRSCLYKADVNSAPKSYSVEEISAYGVRNRKYYKRAEIKIQSATDNVFLDCLINGPLRLYVFDKRFFIEESERVQELTMENEIVTKDNRSFSVPINTYRGTLLEAMRDCPATSALIGSTKLSKNDLVKLFTEYYQCTGKNFSRFESSDHRIRANLNFTMGTALSRIKILEPDGSYNFLQNAKPTFTYSFVASFLLEYSQISIKDRTKFRTGLAMSVNNNKLNYQSPANLIYDLSIKNIRLEVPMVLKHNFDESNRGAYIFGGFGLNTFLKWDEKLRISIYSTGATYAVHSDMERPVLFLSIQGGIGYNFRINKRTLFIEVDCNDAQINKYSTSSTMANVINFGCRGGFAF